MLLVGTIVTALLAPGRRSCLLKSYGYILTSSSFVSTQAWFRQAFCCTYGTRCKYHLSAGLDTLWPLILQPAWLAPTAPSPRALPGFARIRCLLQDCACATLFVETSMSGEVESIFGALAARNLRSIFPYYRANFRNCAQIRKVCTCMWTFRTFLGRRCPEAPGLPTKSSILSQVWSVEAAPIPFNLEAVFGFLGISNLKLVSLVHQAGHNAGRFLGSFRRVLVGKARMYSSPSCF